MVRRKAGTLLPFELEIVDATMELQDSEAGAYGFAVAKQLEAAGGMLGGYGTLYKALGRLTDLGVLEAVWEDPALSEGAGRPRRRFYRVTGEGAVLRASERERLRGVAPFSSAVPAVRPA